MRVRTILATAALVTASVIGGASTAAADGEPGAGASGSPVNSPGTVSAPSSRCRSRCPSPCARTPPALSASATPADDP